MRTAECIMLKGSQQSPTYYVDVLIIWGLYRSLIPSETEPTMIAVGVDFHHGSPLSLQSPASRPPSTAMATTLLCIASRPQR